MTVFLNAAFYSISSFGRFKIGAEGPFQFSWRDLYTGAEFVMTELSYELASVLYNIGKHTTTNCQPYELGCRIRFYWAEPFIVCPAPTPTLL